VLTGCVSTVLERRVESEVLVRNVQLVADARGSPM
jgi:hypothetical protein